MIRRLIILLLIVGCDNSTEAEDDIHPLVGKWKFSKFVDCESNASIDMSEGDLEPITNWVLTLNANNTAISEECDSMNNCTTYNIEWSTTSNTLKLVDLYYYSITGDTLTYYESSNGILCYTFVKQ